MLPNIYKRIFQKFPENIFCSVHQQRKTINKAHPLKGNISTGKRTIQGHIPAKICALE